MSRELLQQNRGNNLTSKERKEYMAQPRVREYNNAMTKKCFSGRPCAFNSVEEVNKEISDFMDLCDKTTTIPTVMGIATWLGCNRDTIYAHANNPNSQYSDIFKRFINICHLSLENGTIDGKINPVTYIFMGKNYFNLSDSKEINLVASQSSGVNTQETADALRKQIEEENIPNASVVSEH